MPPIVRIVQEDIDVVSREIDSDIFPRREREERPVGSINALAAQRHAFQMRPLVDDNFVINLTRRDEKRACLTNTKLVS